MPVPVILAAASLGINVVGKLFGHSAANKQAKAEEQAAATLKRNTTAAANEAASFSNAQLDEQLLNEQSAAQQSIEALMLRRSQERTAASRSNLQTDRAARAADATARLSAGAAGVSGASVSALLTDVEAQAGQARLATDQNLAATTRQIDMQRGAVAQNLAIAERGIALSRIGVDVDRRARINGVENIQTAPRPNPFMTGLQIIGDGLDFADQYLKTKKPT
jgi:hypothetical protein